MIKYIVSNYNRVAKNMGSGVRLPGYKSDLS